MSCELGSSPANLFETGLLIDDGYFLELKVLCRAQTRKLGSRIKAIEHGLPLVGELASSAGIF